MKFSISVMLLVFCFQSGTIANYMITSGTGYANYNDSSGFIYDSGGPAGGYGNNEHGFYIINGANSTSDIYATDLTVLSNNLENPYDSLIISDISYNRRYVLTGTQTGNYRFSGAVQIEFHSNFSVTAAGFAIRWNRIYQRSNSNGGYDSSTLSGWYFDPAKLYVRGGLNFANNWSPDSSGILSFSYGANQAKGQYSFAAGRFCSANGIGSTAFGIGSVAEGTVSFAGGSSCNATGVNAVSMGYSNIASGAYSTALGQFTTASGFSSLTMGVGNSAESDQSQAFGFDTHAKGTSSTTFGYGTIVNTANGFVIGVYNDNAAGDPYTIDQQNRLFQIGNGLSNGVRSNAMTVLRNGNVGIGELFPTVPLNLKAVAGNKISLFGNGTNHFGLGTQAGLMQMYAPTSADDIAFGYGNSNSFTENMRVKGTGDATVKGNLSVQNGKGLVRTISNTQEKKLSASVTVSTSFAAGETKTFAVTWPESFSAAPDAYVGNVTGGSGGWAEVVMSISGAGTTGATLYVYNPRTSPVTPNFTVKVIAIGAQ